MFGNSLASIYFLPDKLLVIELSSNRKKIIRHASVDLPENLIKNYKVTDPASFSKVIKNVWQKFGIREKSVRVVLPEFSTFTKLLKLPHLPPSELNEAVNWQAQEFLPTLPEDLVMDWKIVERSEEGFIVLLVTLSRQLLMGYVDSVEKAGLFPLIVETPSVGLVRLSRTKKDSVLTIYRNFGETLLMISQEEKIIGTSVLGRVSIEEVIKTVGKMLRHYKDYKVGSVLGGGLEFDKELMQKLTDDFKLPIETLSVDIKGLDNIKLQEYLIPLSILLTEPLEPADPKSLNLLPTHLVEKYKSARLKFQVWGLTLLSTLLVWIPFLIVIGTYLLLTQQINLFKSENAKTAAISQQRKNAVNDVSSINSTSEKILKIKNEFILSQKILNQIYEAKPSGLVVNKYDLDLDKGKIVLGGVSTTRNSLIEFKKNLETNTNFVEVTIPISSFEKELNVEFEISFAYKPLLKKEMPKVRIQEESELTP